MKIYKKMEAVVTDLSEVLDEVISFDVYAASQGVKVEKRKLAYAHYMDDEERAYQAQFGDVRIQDEKKYDSKFFSQQPVS